MNKSNTKKPNPISIANAEDAVFEAIGTMIKVTGVVSICTSYNAKDDTFDMTKDPVYKGLTASLLRVFTKFAQSNIELAEQTVAEDKPRYGKATSKTNPLVEIAKKQQPKLEDAGFFDICDVLEDTQQAMYPPRK